MLAASVTNRSQKNNRFLDNQLEDSFAQVVAVILGNFRAKFWVLRNGFDEADDPLREHAGVLFGIACDEIADFGQVANRPR